MIVMAILPEFVTQLITEIRQHPLELHHRLVTIVPVLIPQHSGTLTDIIDFYLELIHSRTHVKLFFLNFCIRIKRFLEFKFHGKYLFDGPEVLFFVPE